VIQLGECEREKEKEIEDRELEDVGLWTTMDWADKKEKRKKLCVLCDFR